MREILKIREWECLYLNHAEVVLKYLFNNSNYHQLLYNTFRKSITGPFQYKKKSRFLFKCSKIILYI